MKTILVPTDFSGQAANAMNYALDLAAKENAKILLLHVISPVSAAKNLEKARLEADRKMQPLYTDIIESKKIGCEKFIMNGSAGKKILLFIEEKKPDLVVMGMKGSGGGLQRVMGSAATEVIEKSPCPVLVVPQNAVFKELQKITYATDYFASDTDALKILADMAKPFHAQITLLHVSDRPQTAASEKILLKEFKDRVAGKTGYQNLGFHLLAGKNIQKELREYAENFTIDLLVMSMHHRSIIDKIFGSSITKEMVFHTAVPLLVFHHKQKSWLFIFGLAINK